MIKLSLTRNTIIFLVGILCLLKKSTTLEASSVQNGSAKLLGSDHSESNGAEEAYRNDKPETTTSEDTGKLYVDEEDSKVVKTSPVNETKRISDRFSEFFNPFMSLPFFPFHIPSLKRNIFQVNSSDKSIRSEKDGEFGGNRSPRKPKQFLFIDFAFNVQGIPVRNLTTEEKSSAVTPYPKRTSERMVSKNEKENKNIPFPVLGNDGSFFDDSLPLTQEMDEFLPKSDLMFFDFPFHRNQNKKQNRGKRDQLKVVKNDIGMLMDIFDRAISRTKREMEQTIPFWDLMRGGRKSVRSERKEGTTLNKLSSFDDESFLQHPENKWTEGIPTKMNRFDSIPPNGPILLGNVVKMGEINFRDESPKTKKKKKRRNASGKKEKRGYHEKTVQLTETGEPVLSSGVTSLKNMFRKMGEENDLVGESGKKTRGTQDAKIMDLITQWDRRAMEEQIEGKPSKSETFETYSKQKSDGESVPEGGRALMHKDEGLKYVNQIPGKWDVLKTSAGFEVVKPQQSSARMKRQGNGGSGNWENVTASKDEVRKNITRVLGQFFSMIKKLGDSKYQDNVSQEMDDIIWPELNQVHGSRSYAKESPKRRGRQSDEDADTPPLVADLNFLFLTVTLPTALAFTLLLVICFVNLRAKSWLCKKVFEPRNVYIVEDGTGKAKQPEDKSSPKEHSKDLKEIPEEPEETEKEGKTGKKKRKEKEVE